MYNNPIAPNETIFQEIKSAAIAVCKLMNNKGGYATEKLNYIEGIENIKDNAMVFYRMMDVGNRTLMRTKLGKDSLNYIDKN